MPGNTLDIIVILAALFAGYMGYRRGFIVGALSFLGFVVGAALGLQFSPAVTFAIASPILRMAIGVAIVFALALICQMGAFLIGAHLRDRIKHPSLQTTDGVGGFLVSTLGVLLVTWLLAVPLASGPSPWLASQVRYSAVISTVDRVMPDSVRSVTDTFADAIRSSDFPNIFEGLPPTDVPSVAPPDPALQGSGVVENAAESVVKVRGQAPQCNRRSEGTGFVYAPRRVMTNAHVVAGTQAVEIVHNRRTYDATVVLYDPRNDLAVLHVPDLSAPALHFVDDAPQGGDAIVVGFPLDGAYTASAARIRQRTPITGPDIYHETTVEREVYAIRGSIKPGNSGGPLLSPDGNVYGVVFAVAADDPETGYVLTAAQVAETALEGLEARGEASTRRCD